MNRKELISSVKATVRSVDPLARVILFGSRARGDNNKFSDWDFLILVSQEANERVKGQIRDSLIDTELEAEQVISTVIYSQDQWPNYQITPLFQNIIKEGVEV
jgi:predicted nucleotidyltransferase